MHHGHHCSRERLPACSREVVWQSGAVVSRVPARKAGMCQALQHGIAEVLAESLTARSTVWRRLPLRRAGLLPTPLLPLHAQATLLLSGQH